VCQRKIDYVVEVPVDGGDSLWGWGVYFSPSFPDEPLPHKMVSHRPTAALENPCSIKRAWQQVLAQASGKEEGGGGYR